MQSSFDVIVVGVGGMGSATVYELARRGARVLGLEQYDIPHDLGSSHGVNRVIRLTYWEDPAYVPLLRRAYELWREIENRHGERILFVTGSIDAGRADSRMVTGSLRSCEIHALAHEVLDAAALHDRFPGYALPDDMAAVYQPDGGFVLSERAIVTYVEEAHRLGAAIHAREPVLGWEADGDGVAVRTRAATYRASRLVITAGAWTAGLVPAIGSLARPERQVLLWAQPRKPEYFSLGVFPVFNMEAPEGHFYGYPIYGHPGFKIGKYHHRREEVNPDQMDRCCHPEDEAVVREAVRRYFPDADGPTMGLKTCLFTNSPDGHFVLDRHPTIPAVAVAAGFSGHGFKFCSVVGEIMAEMAIKGESRHNLDLFRLARFDVSPDSEVSNAQ